MLQNFDARCSIHRTSIYCKQISIMCSKSFVHCESFLLKCIFFSLKPLVYEMRKEMFLKKYSALIERDIVQRNRVFEVPELKHLCRLSLNLLNVILGALSSLSFIAILDVKSEKF